MLSSHAGTARACRNLIGPSMHPTQYTLKSLELAENLKTRACQRFTDLSLPHQTFDIETEHILHPNSNCVLFLALRRSQAILLGILFQTIPHGNLATPRCRREKISRVSISQLTLFNHLTDNQFTGSHRKRPSFRQGPEIRHMLVYHQLPLDPL